MDNFDHYTTREGMRRYIFTGISKNVGLSAYRKRAVRSLWTTLAEAYAFISADWDKCEHSEYHPESDIPLLFS